MAIWADWTAILGYLESWTECFTIKLPKLLEGMGEKTLEGDADFARSLMARVVLAPCPDKLGNEWCRTHVK